MDQTIFKFLKQKFELLQALLVLIYAFHTTLLSVYFVVAQVLFQGLGPFKQLYIAYTIKCLFFQEAKSWLCQILHSIALWFGHGMLMFW